MWTTNGCTTRSPRRGGAPDRKTRRSRRPKGGWPPTSKRWKPTSSARDAPGRLDGKRDRKSTRLNSSHGYISYAVFCLKKKKQNVQTPLQERQIRHLRPLRTRPGPPDGAAVAAGECRRCKESVRHVTTDTSRAIGTEHQ